MRTVHGWVHGWVILGGLLSGTAGSGQQAIRVVPFDSPGIRVTVETGGDPGGEPGGRMERAIESWQSQLGPVIPGARPIEKTGAADTVTAIVERFRNDANHLHAFLATQKTQGVCHVQADTRVSGVAAVLPTALRRCTDALAEPSGGPAEPSGTSSRAPSGGVNAAPPSAGEGEATSPPSAMPGSAPPAHPENWQLVEGVYFQSGGAVGAGGMVVVTYEPVVLLRDGRYYEIGSAALEDTDLAAMQARRPAAFGRWSRNGDAFRLVNSKGGTREMKLQDGEFFRAYSAEEGGNLAGKYERVSGGGTSAMGGQLTVLAQHDMTFTQDGRFLTKSSMGALDTGGSTGVGVTAGSKKRMPAPGSYSLKHHTITLRYPDGREERHFFAYASKKSPAQISRDMIFIDDDPMTSEDVE